jgi:hypothetical protein
MRYFQLKYYFKTYQLHSIFEKRYNKNNQRISSIFYTY